MFPNNGEKKLDWMYKGPNALVDREDYLLGRGVDKTLEQLNEEEKKKSTNQLLPTPKNHVEHECIPPSIRDYNKLVPNDQVDLQAKLQEDPLVLIKRQEEETRRQFLQNPVQLKKLQDAMQAQLKNKKKRKTEKKMDKALRKKLKLLNKQLKLKDGYKQLKFKSEELDDEAILDTILMHRFNSLKNELDDKDLKNILLGNFSESDSSDSEDNKGKYFKSLNLNNCEEQRKKEKSSRYREKSEKKVYERGTKKDERKKSKQLSEEEKEALRKSMMQQADVRTKEGLKKYEKFKKEKNKSEKLVHHGEEFIRQQFLKSANSSSVADRIKANVNNIQRSKSAMESNFLK